MMRNSFLMFKIQEFINLYALNKMKLNIKNYKIKRQ